MTKYKLYLRLKANVINHPKIFYNKLKKQKWLKFKKYKAQHLSEYSSIIMAKQRLRAFYGNISEKQIRCLYRKAKYFSGITAINFIQLIESRLDTVLFRLRFANTFEEIKQYITHKHILVNKQVVSSPSFLLKEGDIISIHKNSFSFISKKILISFKLFLNKTE